MTTFLLMAILMISVLPDMNAEKTLGQIVDEKVQKIEEEVKVFRLIHGSCAPCFEFQHQKEFCDCRQLQPRRDCLAFRQAGYKVNGLYKTIGMNFNPLYVYCDQTTQGGGWTVIQRRKDGSQNFYRNWDDYKHGFGDLKGEFWLGNDNIHQLTKGISKKSSLLINMNLTNNVKPVWAKYNRFWLDDESAKYTLHVSGFSGNVTKDALNYHNNGKFSTYDNDNDKWSGNCASDYKGGWWYKYCHTSHLNGLYRTGGDWKFNGWSRSDVQAKFSEMKVKRN